MAKIKLDLDTRNNSKRKDGSFPIVIRLFHKSSRLITLPYSTTSQGWDAIHMRLKKSVLINRNIDCDEANLDLEEKLYEGKKVIRDLGKSIHKINVVKLCELIEDRWESMLDLELKNKVENNITLRDWGNVLINRKLVANQPGSATWYKNGISAFIKFNDNNDILLFDITVAFLNNFEAYHLGKGNSNNTISSYIRSVRAIYNKAIWEDQFVPLKNCFDRYKIPRTMRTKKKAVPKEKIIGIKELKYKKYSALWHAKNYALIMFYCRGMNFIDLVKIKQKDIVDDRLNYGRSKTGDPFSVKITSELATILEHYLNGQKSNDFLFPTNYDGRSDNYQKYKTQRRRMNERLKIIASDAKIDGDFTTYSIRHSWATIAKYLGISTEIISEGLGHNSLRTTEVYLKSFENKILDEANERIVA